MAIRLIAAATILGGLAAVPAAQSGATPVAHSTLVGTDPADRTPHILDGQIVAVVDLGSRVIVGGSFTQVKKFSESTVFTRTGLVAYDKATGNIDQTFNPVLDGSVKAMVAAPGGTGVIIGGSFKTVNGVATTNLAKLSATTGAVVSSFKVSTNSWVSTMALSGNRLFIGGLFTKVDGLARSRLAAVDATSGAIDHKLAVPVEVPNRGDVQLWQMAVTPDGRRLVIVGNFQQVGGQPRVQAATIDVASSPAKVTAWQTNWFRYGVCRDSYDYYVKDVDIDPTGRYFVVVTTGALGNFVSGTCDSASRWEIAAETAGVNPTWREYSGGDSYTAVTVTGAAVYLAGHPRWGNNAGQTTHDTAGPGAVDRAGIEALDPTSGVPLSWTVQRERGIQVGTLTPTTSGLYIGSDSAQLGNEFHPGLGFLPSSGGATPENVVQPSLPTHVVLNLANGRRGTKSFNGSSFGSSTVTPDDGSGWGQVRGALRSTNRTLRFMVDGTIQASANGTTWTPVPTWRDGAAASTNITGVAYLNGKMYYTLAGNSKLYARGFTPDGALVGTLRYTLSNGTDFSTTKGLMAVGGALYQATKAGNLARVSLSTVHGGDVPDAAAARLQVTGRTTVSGPSVDGLNWGGIVGLHTE